MAADAPPQVGSVTPCTLEVGVSKKHPTTLLIFSVHMKILLKNLPFLGQIENLPLIPCRKQDKRVGGMNSLCFSLIHCEYTKANLAFLIDYNSYKTSVLTYYNSICKVDICYNNEEPKKGQNH